MTTLQYVTSELPLITPILLVYLVGVGLSLVNLKRQAKPAVFAMVGFGILFLTTTVFPFLRGYLFASYQQRDLTIDELHRWLLPVGIIRVLFEVAAFSLLMAAVFSDRSAPARTSDVMDANPSEYVPISGR